MGLKHRELHESKGDTGTLLPPGANDICAELWWTMMRFAMTSSMRFWHIFIRIPSLSEASQIESSLVAKISQDPQKRLGRRKAGLYSDACPTSSIQGPEGPLGTFPRYKLPPCGSRTHLSLGPFARRRLRQRGFWYLCGPDT